MLVLRVLLVCFEGLARLSRRVWRRFVRGSREISLVPSLHRASTDALIVFLLSTYHTLGDQTGHYNVNLLATSVSKLLKHIDNVGQSLPL